MPRPRGTRRGTGRRNVVTAAIAACAASGTLVTLGVSSAGGTPLAPQHYTDYVMFAEAGLHVGYDSDITGTIGVRANRNAAPNAGVALRFGGGSKLTGNAYVGQDVNMANATSITGTLVYKDKLTRASTATVGTITKADPGLPPGPVPTQWPTAGPLGPRAGYCGVDHVPDVIKTANAQRINLSPGSFGTIKVGSNTTITFNGAGDYYLDDLKSGNATFVFNTNGGPVRLFVCNEVALATVNMTPTLTNPSKFYTEVWGSGGADANSFEVSNGAWTGDVVVPRGGWHYGSGASGSADVHGYVWADHIDLEHAVKVHRSETTPPGNPTATTTSSAPASSSTPTSIIIVPTTTPPTTTPPTTASITTTTTTLPDT
jgi:hypothetical protein